MIEIVEVPPEELPKLVTARYVAHSLGEHLEAFLAANNMSGWKVDEDYILRDDRIGDQLLLLSQSTGLYVSRFKRMAKILMKLGRANGAELKLTTAQEMLAHALGYNCYQIAYRCRTVDDFIENVWPMGAAMSLDTLNKEAVELRVNPDLLKRLRERIQFNVQRDKQFSSSGTDPLAAKQLRRERKKRQRTQGREVIRLRPTE